MEFLEDRVLFIDLNSEVLTELLKHLFQELKLHIMHSR